MIFLLFFVGLLRKAHSNYIDLPKDAPNIQLEIKKSSFFKDAIDFVSDIFS